MSTVHYFILSLLAFLVTACGSPECKMEVTHIRGNFWGGLTKHDVSTQKELEAFRGQTHIDGHLRICASDDIEDLSALSELESVDGNLVIYDNSHLSSIEGLRSLESVSRGIFVIHNPELTLIDSFDALHTTSDFANRGAGITIGGNLNLKQVSGFRELRSARLAITSNENLESIDIGSNSTGVALIVQANPALKSIRWVVDEPSDSEAMEIGELRIEEERLETIELDPRFQTIHDLTLAIPTANFPTLEFLSGLVSLGEGMIIALSKDQSEAASISLAGLDSLELIEIGVWLRGSFSGFEHLNTLKSGGVGFRECPQKNASFLEPLISIVNSGDGPYRIWFRECSNLADISALLAISPEANVEVSAYHNPRLPQCQVDAIWSHLYGEDSEYLAADYGNGTALDDPYGDCD